MSQPSITCPQCGRTSYNPNDIAEGYCGNCHDWTSTGPNAFHALIPAAPVNVQLHLIGGKVVPVECRYDGVDERGMHRWVVITEVEPMLVESMTCDAVPPRTGITFPLRA